MKFDISLLDVPPDAVKPAEKLEKERVQKDKTDTPATAEGDEK